ncbi:MAG: SIMPL domain-containing protein [Anaerolineales bacterium]|jgi:uncharacterized protein YggE
MRTKLTFVSTLLALILALVLTACGPAAAQARTLTVTGTGTVYLTPDIAYITIGVHTEDPDITQAIESNNSQAQAVVNALQGSGIDAKDLQTSNFSLNSSTQTDQLTGKPTGTTYMVDNTVSVTVRDLSKLASLLDTAVHAGANNINSISFDVADNTSGLTQARQKAMANAGTLATELAKTAGVNLGSIQTITYSENPGVPFYGYALGGGGAVAAPSSNVPINPGQLQLTATVTVTYGLK